MPLDEPIQNFPVKCKGWWLRLRKAFGFNACCLCYVGTQGERGIYECWCGARAYGLKCPVVIRPGETVSITLSGEIDAS